MSCKMLDAIIIFFRYFLCCPGTLDLAFLLILLVKGLNYGDVFWPPLLSFFHFRGFDDEMRAVVARNLEGRGIKLHPGTNLTEVHIPQRLVAYLLFSNWWHVFPSLLSFLWSNCNMLVFLTSWVKRMMA